MMTDERSLKPMSSSIVLEFGFKAHDMMTDERSLKRPVLGAKNALVARRRTT